MKGVPVRQTWAQLIGTCVLAQRGSEIYRALPWKWSFDPEPSMMRALCWSCSMKQFAG